MASNSADRLASALAIASGTSCFSLRRRLKADVITPSDCHKEIISCMSDLLCDIEGDRILSAQKLLDEGLQAWCSGQKREAEEMIQKAQDTAAAVKSTSTSSQKAARCRFRCICTVFLEEGEAKLAESLKALLDRLCRSVLGFNSILYQSTRVFHDILPFLGPPEHKFTVLYNTWWYVQQGLYSFEIASTIEPFVSVFGKRIPESHQQLLSAVRSGNKDLAKKLLQKTPVNTTAESSNESLIMIAVERNDMKMAEMLLAANADPDVRKGWVTSPLLHAVSEGNAELASMLLDAMADPNLEAKDGITPLSYCFQEGKVAMIKLLLNRKADVNFETRGGMTALKAALSKNRPEIGDMLKLFKAVDINRPCKDGETALMFAVDHQCEKSIIKALLDAKADPSSDVSLVKAVKTKDVDIVKVLLDAGAASWLPSQNEQAFLMGVHDRLGSDSVVMYLSGQGGVTSMIMEMSREHEFTKFYQKKSALTAACFGGNMEIIKLLLDFSVDVNAKDGEGKTALHAAVDGEAPKEVCEALIKAKASVNAQDKMKNSVLDHAIMKGWGYKSVQDWLKEQGCKGNRFTGQ